MLMHSNCTRKIKRVKTNYKERDIFFEKRTQSNVEYSVKFVKFERSNVVHKWVGAQMIHNSIYFIPNDEERVLMYGNCPEYYECKKCGEFKWTGGCVWNGSVFGFPRSANSFLKITNNHIEEIPLSIVYNKEHHYSGVCCENGIVYQPPRNTNHILKTDLKTGISEQIDIVDAKYGINFRYCGSIIHPNGFIYFFPENGKVIKLDPELDKWSFIGKRVSTMCFDAKIGNDGNIYGFSAYNNGIMKINVKYNTVEMIHKEFAPKAYGTKYGIDGWLYSIPGDGAKIWKYNIDDDIVEEVFDLKDSSKAKYAGGVTLQNGKIVCVPATASSILILEPNCEGVIPDGMYSKYINDNY